MKILMLTWEFPPVVTGGLGMACYGMARGLLKKGVFIDLIIPASEGVYFPLRKESDADFLPYRFPFGPPQHAGSSFASGDAATEIVRELLGKSFSAYRRIDSHPPPPPPAGAGAGVFPARARGHDDLIPGGRGALMDQVRAYTDMAATIAGMLDFDFIHANDWLTLPAAMKIKNFSGKPLAVHIHSTEFDRVGGAGNEYIHRIEHAGIQNADRVITVSAYTAREIEQHYMLEAGKISVVHNSYAVRNISRGKRRIFKEPTVLFMGRITAQKGPDYFLQTARKILRQEKNVRFIMAGKGDMENQIIRKSADFEMGAHFLFSGFLNREEVEEVLSAADIFVLPSVSEPFGIVCLEAMSYGAVPVISKKSGVSEIITNAFKVDFWDCDRVAQIILELVRDPDRMRRMGAECSEEVEKLQWDEAADKLIDIFKKLLTK